jgi:hypothetical protein
MILTAIIISSGGGQDAHYQPKLCRELASFLDSTALLQAYPDCASLDAWVLVKADITKGPEQKAAAMNVSFGMAVWLAVTIHAIGIEAYVGFSSMQRRFGFLGLTFSASTYTRRNSASTRDFSTATGRGQAQRFVRDCTYGWLQKEC